MSYYVRNISAEMATVLRRMATTLIRLREKLELQFFADILQQNGVSREWVSGYTRAGPLGLLPSALAETAAIGSSVLGM